MVSGFFRDSLILRKRGATNSLRVRRMGRYFLSDVDFCKDASRRVRGPVASASSPEIIKKAPDLSNGGFHLLFTGDGLYHFGPPPSSSACKVVNLGESMGGCLTKPTKIVVKLHANRGHASAQQLRRVLADSVGGNMRPIACADEVLG